MPVIKSAKKKLRQDIKREKVNDLLRDQLKTAIKIAKKNKTVDKIRVAIKSIDKATKKGIIHKNKAARIKSSLSKLIKGSSLKKAAATKPSKKKTASKRTK